MNGNRKSEALAEPNRRANGLASGYKRKAKRSAERVNKARMTDGTPINETTTTRDANGRWPWQIPPDPMGPVKLPARWARAWFERTGDPRYMMTRA